MITRKKSPGLVTSPQVRRVEEKPLGEVRRLGHLEADQQCGNDDQLDPKEDVHRIGAA